MRAHLDESRLLCKCLLQYAQQQPQQIVLQFHLLRAFTHRNLADFHFLRDWFTVELPRTYTIHQKRLVFFQFLELYNNPNFSSYLKSLVIQHILIPIFTHAFDNNQGTELILGESGQAAADTKADCVLVLINRVIPEQNGDSYADNDIHKNNDALLVQLFRLFSLLVEKAHEHIGDAERKQHGQKLRRIITFAWPCLMPKNCVDPASKYHGHLLLAHIIARFSLSRRIVLQAFYSLLKAHTHEARPIVRSALDVILPSMPLKQNANNCKDAYVHWTRKILVEEGHTISQLMHVLLLVVRHQRVYYPANASLIQQMVASMQRLGLAPNNNREQRRLAVDVADSLIKWEVRRVGEMADAKNNPPPPPPSTSLPPAPVEGAADPVKVELDGTAGVVPAVQPLSFAIERKHRVTIVNFLLCMACQVNETSQGNIAGDQTSRRCIQLLCTALRSDIWPDTDLNLSWLEKILSQADGGPPNCNACVALDVLSKLLGIFQKSTVMSVLMALKSGLAVCVFCTNSKVVTAMQNVLLRIFSMHPRSVNKQTKLPDELLIIPGMDTELESLFIAVKKVVDDGLSSYDKPNAPVSSEC